MAVQASLVWPKIDEILEFEDFSDRFFSYHPVVPWNDRETLPATQGPLPRHSGSLLQIIRVAADPVGPYGKARFRDFQAFIGPFLLLSPCTALEWPGITSSHPRRPPTTLWATYANNKGCRGARMPLPESLILRFSSFYQTDSTPIAP